MAEARLLMTSADRLDLAWATTDMRPTVTTLRREPSARSLADGLVPCVHRHPSSNLNPSRTPSSSSRARTTTALISTARTWSDSKLSHPSFRWSYQSGTGKNRHIVTGLPISPSHTSLLERRTRHGSLKPLASASWQEPRAPRPWRGAQAQNSTSNGAVASSLTAKTAAGTERERGEPGTDGGELGRVEAAGATLVVQQLEAMLKEPWTRRTRVQATLTLCEVDELITYFATQQPGHWGDYLVPDWPSSGPGATPPASKTAAPATSSDDVSLSQADRGSGSATVSSNSFTASTTASSSSSGSSTSLGGLVGLSSPVRRRLSMVVLEQHITSLMDRGGCGADDALALLLRMVALHTPPDAWLCMAVLDRLWDGGHQDSAVRLLAVVQQKRGSGGGRWEGRGMGAVEEDRGGGGGFCSGFRRGSNGMEFGGDVVESDGKGRKEGDHEAEATIEDGVHELVRNDWNSFAVVADGSSLSECEGRRLGTGERLESRRNASGSGPQPTDCDLYWGSESESDLSESELELDMGTGMKVEADVEADVDLVVHVVRRALERGQYRAALALPRRLRHDSVWVSAEACDAALHAAVKEQELIASVEQELKELQVMGRVKRLQRVEQLQLQIYSETIQNEGEKILEWGLEALREELNTAVTEAAAAATERPDDSAAEALLQAAAMEAALHEKMLALWCIAGKGEEAERALWRVVAAAGRPLTLDHVAVVVGTCSFRGNVQALDRILRVAEAFGCKFDEALFSLMVGGAMKGGHVAVAASVMQEMVKRRMVPDPQQMAVLLRLLQREGQVEAYLDLCSSLSRAGLVGPCLVYLYVDLIRICIIRML